MKKKGVKAQVSIFVILAVLILVGAGIFFIFSDKGKNKNINELDARDIYSFTKNCIRQTGEESVYYIGQRGGYFQTDNLTNYKNVPYYIYYEKNYMPSKNMVEKELARYVDENLFFCISGFNDFSDLKITSGDLKTNCNIDKGKVIFNVEYPLTIARNNRTSYVKNFENIVIPVNLDKIYSIAEEITKEYNQTEVPCVSCMNDIAAKKDVYIDVILTKDESYVFKITDAILKINGEDYEFYFAVK